MICSMWIDGQVGTYLVTVDEEATEGAHAMLDCLRAQTEQMNTFEMQSEWLVREEEVLLQVLHMAGNEEGSRGKREDGRLPKRQTPPKESPKSGDEGGSP